MNDFHLKCHKYPIKPHKRLALQTETTPDIPRQASEFNMAVSCTYGDKHWCTIESLLSAELCVLLFLYNTVLLSGSQFSPKSPHKTLHSSPMRVGYGVSFVSLIFDSHSAIVITVLNVILWKTWLHYNSLWLYLFSNYPHIFFVGHSQHCIF